MAFLALAASLTLDLLFFFGARGSSASFTFFAFDRGAGGGHEPPLTASARTGRGRASAATVNAASSRARARAIVDASLCSLRAARRLAALQVALLVLSVTARAAAATQPTLTEQAKSGALARCSNDQDATLAAWLPRTTIFKGLAC